VEAINQETRKAVKGLFGGIMMATSFLKEAAEWYWLLVRTNNIAT